MLPRVLLCVVRPTALAMIAAGGATPVAAAQVVISPLSGTPDASPSSQISVLGIAPDRIASVRVTGAVSGPDPGRLRAYRGVLGASYVLGHALAQGERVTVRVGLRGRSRPVRGAFTVARLGALQPALNLPIMQPDKLDNFPSVPGLMAPRITVLRGARSAGGDIFLAPLPSPIIHPGAGTVLSIHPVGPGGPMIINARGELVWFHQLTPPDVAANLRLQRFGGRQVLTWWQGGVTPSAYGLGEGVIADSSYRTLRIVKTGNGYSADIHEFTLTPSGEALFTIESPIRVHLAGTPRGALSPLLDSIVQQVDVRTGLVSYEWHSYGHIPLADSYATPSTSSTFDAFHVNSIQALSGERMLISARDTSAIYMLAPSGRVRWTLGGKASSFRLGPGARFYFQHDAQLIAPDRVSLFDDEAGPPIEGPYSRGLILSLDLRRHRASVLRQYSRRQDTIAESEGSVEPLAAGGAFVGFGSTGFFSQFTSTGRIVFDGALPADDGSYRVYRFPWTATPTTRPALAVRPRAAGGVFAFVSWNGSTSVVRWQVLDRAGRVLATARRDGRFETRIAVRRAVGALHVRAVGARGRVLGVSPPVAS